MERALGHRAVAEEGDRDAAVARAAAPRSPRPTAIGRPAATMPLAPKMPSVGSAMCIEPPRPRLVPSSLPISSANIPSGSRPLARQCPWPRWVEVMTSAGAERPAGARPPRPPARSTGARSRAPRRRGRARPPAPRSRGSRASAGASRGGRSSVEDMQTMYCTGRYKTREGPMTEQIEIPASFPERGDVGRQARRAHRRRPGPRRACSPTPSPRPAPRWRSSPAPRPTSRRSPPSCPGPSLVLQRRRDRRGTSTRRSPTPPSPSGAALDVWICNAGISPIVAGPRETEPAVWRQVLDVNLTGAFLGARAAARVMGDGGRLIFTGSVLGERPRAGPHRLQRVEGRARRAGQGPRPRPRAGRHHRERRRARLVRLAAGRGVEERPEARRPRSSATPPSAAGATPPTSPAPTSSSRPTRRRSSPAPSSTSTGGTCSYERTARRVVVDHRCGRHARRRARPRQLRRRARHRPRAERRQRRPRSTRPSPASPTATARSRRVLADVERLRRRSRPSSPGPSSASAGSTC